MKRSMLALCPVVVLLLVSVGCGGGGGGNDVIDTPPANVAGIWSGVTNNAGSAILTGCTGDFATFNGLTVAGISSSANCVYAGPPVMTQYGTSLTAQGLTPEARPRGAAFSLERMLVAYRSK